MGQLKSYMKVLRRRWIIHEHAMEQTKQHSDKRTELDKNKKETFERLFQTCICQKVKPEHS